MGKPKLCKGVTKQGRSCPNPVQHGRDYCYTHDPGKGRERAEAHARGGARTRINHAGDVASVPGQIRTLEGCLLLLDYTRAEVMAAENSLDRARVLISLAGEYRQALAVGELENRIAALEAALRSGAGNSPGAGVA